MRFKKREKVNTEFFLYLCEEYFEKSHRVVNDDFDNIIIESALEIHPEIKADLDDNKEDEIMSLCRRIAVKTLLSISLQRDKKNHLTNILVTKYPEEVEKLLRNSLAKG